MASNSVVLKGTTYNGVSSLEVPVSGGGTALFTDVSDTTAAAADVASGKYFYDALGAYTAGTASSGSGGALKVGVIRPDAVLEQSWTYDKMIVEDEGLTIPNYSTSEQTLKAASVLVTGKQLDNTQYDYIVTARGISTPVYSDSTINAGRNVYSVFSYACEFLSVPSNVINVDGKSSDRYIGNYLTYNTAGATVYWTSATNVRVVSGSNYAAHQNIATPSYTGSTAGTPSVTINSPSLRITGSSYLNSTYWSYLTDIRFQYIVELWRVPHTNNINGYTHTSQVIHAVQCAQSASGTLT